MSVGLNSGIDYTQWLQSSRANYTNGTSENISGTTASNSLERTGESDYFVSESGETCTDGKDDGKIGFFSAVGNALKGVGKTIVNGVKGMFTDSEGNFSLGKTLLSVGMAALCIAVPAVGVAACVVGGVMGAAQVGKGIYNAATADTDAEAKEAWQNIGGGAVTVAGSVVGGKASLSAMKNASTATNGLNSLEKGASLTSKVKAFAADARSSTVNNLSKAGSSIRSGVTAAKESIAEQGGVKQAAKNAASSLKDNAASVAQNLKDTAQSTFTKIKGQGIKQTIKNAGTSITELAKSLPAKGKQILTDLTDTNKSYNQLVAEYGYDNVAQVLQMLAGLEVSTQSI